MHTPTLSSNRIHQTLLNKQCNKHIGPLRHGDGVNAPALEDIARQASKDPAILSRLRFTTGIGLGQTDAVPIRLPALLLPVLNVMENIAALDLPLPRYTVYQATEFIAETNGVSDEYAGIVSSKMEQYLSRYIQELHPALVDFVDLRFGCEYGESVRSSIEAVERDIRFDAMHLISALESSEARHSRKTGQALTYAAANALYNGAYAELYPFKNDLPHDVIAILPVGGKAEKPFFSLTSSASKTNGKHFVIPLITDIGSRPTYYAYPDRHDPLSAAQYVDALNGKVQDGPLRMDLQALVADGATPDLISQIHPSSL